MRPAYTQQASEVVKLANAEKIGLVPLGEIQALQAKPIPKGH